MQMQNVIMFPPKSIVLKCIIRVFSQQHCHAFEFNPITIFKRVVNLLLIERAF